MRGKLRDRCRHRVFFLLHDQVPPVVTLGFRGRVARFTSGHNAPCSKQVGL